MNFLLIFICKFCNVIYFKLCTFLFNAQNVYVQLSTDFQIMSLSFIQLLQMACEDVICLFTFSYGLFVNNYVC
jgi:hypothetical protein